MTGVGSILPEVLSTLLYVVVLEFVRDGLKFHNVLPMSIILGPSLEHPRSSTKEDTTNSS